MTTSAAPRYANWWSRLILAGQFDRQFIVPCEPKPAVKAGLRWLEAWLRPRLESVEIRRPIFLVGLHRSGTTMVQDAICGLPEVAYVTNVMNVYPESPCAAEWVRRRCRLDISGERYLADGVTVSGGTPNEAVNFWRRWLDEDPYDIRYVERTAEELTPERRQLMRDDIRRVLWSFRPAASRFFCKNPCLTPHVALLAELFPDARILHVVRDPRDCVPSLVRFFHRNREQLDQIRRTGRHGVYDTQPFMPYARWPRLTEYVERFGADSVQTAARLWCDGVEWVHERRDRLGHFWEVRYEDIVADPESQLRAILDFCELDVQSAGATYRQHVESIRSPARSIDRDTEALIEDLCAKPMRRLGYATTSDRERLADSASLAG
jgi:hypothetical protein